MATGGFDPLRLSAKAAADLSAKQYHFMRFSAADTVNQSSQAAAQDFAGVLINKPDAAGATATIQFHGECKITAGGALTVNDYVTTNGSGRAAAAGTNEMVAGRVLETATQDGDVVRMLIQPFFSGTVS